MRKLLSLIIIALACTATYAQVPGYMGLKCSLQYQGGISPQWNNLGQSWLPYYSHNIQFGYVVTRRHEIGIQYTRMDYGSAFVGHETQNPSTSTGSVIPWRKYSGNNVTVYVKFFRERKGFIAPLGRYTIIGLSYINSNNRFYVTQDDSSPVGVPYNGYVTGHDIGFMVGFGRNFIIANRMLLTIEGDVNAPLSAGIRAAMSGSDSRGHYDMLKNNNSIDAILFNVLSIKIGLGALLF